MTETELIDRLEHWAEWSSKAYDLNAWGYDVQVSEILKELRDAIRSDLSRLQHQAQIEKHKWERNFCPQCGERLLDGFVELSIHKCTPKKPQGSRDASKL